MTTITAPQRIGPRAMLSLIAGRTAYRMALYAASVLLLAAWGRAEFAPYAAAMGAATWLITVVQMGPEKTALKLLPRARRTHGDIADGLRVFGLAAPVLPLVVAVALLATAPSSHAALYAVAVAQSVALGSVMLGVALHRALNRPRMDTLTFVLLAAGTVVLISLTFRPGISPIAYLSGQLVLTLAAVVMLLRKRADTPRTGRRMRRLLTGTSVLMGAPEVLMTAGTSVLYVELAATGHARQSSELYVVLQGWALIIAFVYLVQRVLQPRLSAWLAARPAAEGASRAVRMARVVIVASAVWLAGAIAVAVALGNDLEPGRLTVALALFIVSRMPIYLLMSQATFVLENTDATGLRTSARGAVVSLLAVATAGAVATPLFGALGAVCALGVKEPVLALNATLRHRGNR